MHRFTNRLQKIDGRPHVAVFYFGKIYDRNTGPFGYGFLGQARLLAVSLEPEADHLVVYHNITLIQFTRIIQ